MATTLPLEGTWEKTSNPIVPRVRNSLRRVGLQYTCCETQVNASQADTVAFHRDLLVAPLISPPFFELILSRRRRPALRTCTGTNLTPRSTRPPYSRSSTPSDSYCAGSAPSRLPTAWGRHCKRCNRGFDRLGALCRETPVFRVGKSRSAKGETEKVSEKATWSTSAPWSGLPQEGGPARATKPRTARLHPASLASFFGNLLKEHRATHRGGSLSRDSLPPLCRF